MAETTATAPATLRNYVPPELETLKLDVLDHGVVVMTVNRPDRMNSQTVKMFEEFNTVGYALRDSDARALILRGAGERAFCAGFDLDEIDVITTMGVRDFLQFQELATGGMSGIRHLPFPVIAAIHGAAAGGGLALALAADIRLVAPTAKFSAAFVKLGLSVGELGTSWQLTRLVGPGRAAEIAYTARLVHAEEAVRIGLANRLVPSAELMDEAIALGSRIASNSPGGIRVSKRALQRNQEISSYAAASEIENRGQTMLARSPDMPEALAAFRQKRPARFTGR
ncbi:enoyl-CoA hydratase/isomerase family protein [Intrasporangium chromatireducens]|nr:enoyl-CoA hydratase-related protein [Intrasporangium chromatireducens]